MSILQKLTEGIVSRDMSKEGAALLNKWEKTGLLEGIQGDNAKNNMARLLENQAKELLREAASTMSGGDVEGFAAVAFPIVRRVFGSLIANELVSVQPMSLPSGLIFFLDFTFQSDAEPGRLGLGSGSLYGGGVVGQQLTGGVDLSDSQHGGGRPGQFYDLVNGFSSPTGGIAQGSAGTGGPKVEERPRVLFSGTYGAQSGDSVALGRIGQGGAVGGDDNAAATKAQVDHVYRLLQYDPAFTSGTTKFVVGAIPVASLTSSNGSKYNKDDLVAVSLRTTASIKHIRRLNQFSSSIGGGPNRSGDLIVVLVTDSGTNAQSGIMDPFDVLSQSLAIVGPVAGYGLSFPIVENFNGTAKAASGEGIGAVVGTTDWGLENNARIPEINLKVDSVSVTAQTKKLKAKWTPELGQDLNAYHNLDAEVELTSILSEQIALEIDREILEDLVKGGAAATYYWSRSPGLFVDKKTGGEKGASSAAPDFTGTVSEWYETLGETINDVSAQIHRKTLRGGANFIVTSPEVANILEFTSGFRANVTHDDSKGTAGTQNVGSLSKRYDVYVDPYFPRNVVLVGRKGSSFLESGYVYSPYVPLQVTPTIFGTEDFVPRKGVMTRYAKKMVRPDMYGLVVVRGLLGESGATA
jgi:hypothetical protein